MTYPPASKPSGACLAVIFLLVALLVTPSVSAVDCVGSFVDTATCSVTCGNGTKTQTFIQTVAATDGGANCTSDNGTTQTTTCSASACPTDCVGAYVDSSSCSLSCGGGSKTQTFMITTVAANGGANCSAENGTTQTVACNTATCVTATDCSGGYVDSSSCSLSCGGGSKTQTFMITTAAANGGANCSAANGTIQTVACNTANCTTVTDCVGTYVDSSSCSVSCGSGSKTQTYMITTAAANGGANCSAANGTTQTVACNTAICATATNCVGTYVDSSSCSVSCGSGSKTQTYMITTAAANGGANCSAANGTTQTLVCNTANCTTDCVGAYTDTTTCSVTCGGGSKSQTFMVTAAAANGGAACSAANGTTQTVSCNAVNCPQSPCIVLKNCRACAGYSTGECGWCPASSSCLMTSAVAGCTTSAGLTSNASLCSATASGPASFTSAADLRTSISTMFGIDPLATMDTLTTTAGVSLINKLRVYGNQLMASADRFQAFVDATGTLPTDYIQRTGSSSPKMLIKTFGTSCVAAVVAAVNISNAASELNITVSTALPSGASKWLSDLLSITRLDSAGNIVKNTNVSFDIECSSVTSLALCRFSSDAPSTCTVLNAANGGLTASTTAGFCTVTSQTSAFVAYQVSANPTCATFSSTSCPSGYRLITSPAVKTCAASTCTSADCCVTNGAASPQLIMSVILPAILGLLLVLMA